MKYKLQTATLLSYYTPQ